jgi:hypothetical protein
MQIILRLYHSYMLRILPLDILYSYYMYYYHHTYTIRIIFYCYIPYHLRYALHTSIIQSYILHSMLHWLSLEPYLEVLILFYIHTLYVNYCHLYLRYTILYLYYSYYYHQNYVYNLEYITIISNWTIWTIWYIWTIWTILSIYQYHPIIPFIPVLSISADIYKSLIILILYVLYYYAYYLVCLIYQY